MVIVVNDSALGDVRELEDFELDLAFGSDENAFSLECEAAHAPAEGQFVSIDTATYQVVVNVVDDGQGNLVATVAYDGGAAPTFKNSYTEPPAPAPTPGGGATTPKNPVVKLFSKTADDAGLMLGAAAVAAGLALVVCGAAACWRRRS